MRIKSIELDDEELPESAVVVMTRNEMIFMALVCGKHSDVTAEERMVGGAEANGAIYDALTGSVFNRFWDDGVDGAATL